MEEKNLLENIYIFLEALATNVKQHAGTCGDMKFHTFLT